ncbi:MAG TPA: hypothetical protein PLO37_13945 [Candidatus Hydrogenedentes bacterium]|nr:hypothetical protein [Candidatus Hydrogenedentota bacterium]HPG67946.1 hypothetical protein [Candidatus Hydrogenedentota bacterium]
MGHENQAASVYYTECYLAFLDILGFRNLVDDSTRDPELAASLVGLISGLADHESREPDPWRGVLLERKGPDTGKIRTWVLQVRTFSDSIVLFVPTESQGLSWLLGKVRYLHDEVISLGYLMRGAVVIGGMYWDDSWSDTRIASEEHDVSVPAGRHTNQTSFITIGPAMVEAYELENERAIYPRIIFSDCLVKHIGPINHISPDLSLNKSVDPGKKAFPLTSGSTATTDVTLMHFMKRDTDGWWFFHVLSEKMHRQRQGRAVIDTTSADGKRFITYQHDALSHDDWMQRVHGFLERRLKEHEGKPAYAKYRWFAGYYNRSLGGVLLPQLEAREDALCMKFRQRLRKSTRLVH